ncbi:MAG: beta-glucuronidase, partial [Bacteroidales bacterium]|nr:beta-glucuronidase [Bacteroidales bacterium]
RLYAVAVNCDTDSIQDRVGFRTIETRGTDVLLNGEKVMLCGVSVHEEKPFDAGGRASSLEEYRTTLSWAKEMNCNFVRLAHYPHGEEEVRLAEELGLMVWSEIPVYWTIQWNNPDTYACAAQQLTDNITRDRNRAGVIIWSVANETPVEARGRKEFLSRLMTLARTLDGTRLVSAAMEKIELPDGTMTVNDPDLVKLADLISFNQYVGWYDGDAEKCDSVNWTFDVQKPVFISEFGGGALAGFHGDRTIRFTEDYQDYMYAKNIAMLSRIPGFAGCSPWILKDFRSPRRMLPGIQDDYNRKGLVSEFGEKKMAFYTMQKWYKDLK